MMQRTAKTVLARSLWMARGTATMMGMAMMLAIVLGVGTSALAAVPGDPLKLGRNNTIDRLTALVGNVAGPMLVVDNDSGAASARALDLRVQPGKAPLTVAPGAGKAPNLNADRLDGMESSQLQRRCADGAIKEYAHISGFAATSTLSTAGVLDSFNCNGSNILVKKEATGFYEVVRNDTNGADDTIGETSDIAVGSVQRGLGGETIAVDGPVFQCASNQPPTELCHSVLIEDGSNTRVDRRFTVVMF